VSYFPAGLRTRMLTVAMPIVVVTSTLGVGMATGAQGGIVTCQGQATTIIGPTDGQNTTGTDGDDVIVAPLSANSIVQGLAGNDTICLVDGPVGGSRDPFQTVLAGAGNDSVFNETTRAYGVRTELGTGADRFVGADYAEAVYGSTSSEVNGDTEVDVIETKGGDDQIASGSAGVANQDVISTGAGQDGVFYWGAAGGALDNGPDADLLSLLGSWAGELAIDNLARRATVGGSTVLTWTAVDAFRMRPVPGSYVEFVGSEADETINVEGTVLDLEAPAAIATGAGDDSVRIENYLPASVDLGDGYDTLTYLACHRAYVALVVSAECLTTDGHEVSTALAGVEYLYGKTADGLTVQGSARAERVTAFAKHVLVRSGPGADRVYAAGRRTTQVVGGRGDDRLKGFARNGVILRGGRGSDVLRGDVGPDRLFGGLGHDVAWGQKGRDRCVAEVRRGCELR
jgi:Ca2+-binding RTX toxin-like protein